MIALYSRCQLYGDNPEKCVNLRCFFTDDTVMTIAVAEAIMQGEKVVCGRGIDSYGGVYVAPDIFIDSMKKWGRLYPNCGYGSRLEKWLFSSKFAQNRFWVNLKSGFVYNLKRLN